MPTLVAKLVPPIGEFSCSKIFENQIFLQYFFESILCYSNVLPGANITYNFWAVNHTFLQTSTIQRTILHWPAVILPPLLFAGFNNFALLLVIIDFIFFVHE